MHKLYVIGIGPGAYEDMTMRAVKALEKSDVIVGYPVYVELIREYFQEKEFLTTPMKREVERCEMAMQCALQGKVTAMISSGDSGIYGMAGLMFEIAEKMGILDKVDIEVIPGITAASSGASVLGAPLIHDFAVISLSDLMTPWEKIEARLTAAAKADLGIVIYNPSSMKRADYLQKACDLILPYTGPERICGIVENIGREGENFRIMTLEELRNTQVNMFTTVFIGNSQTREIAGRMVTPRGYLQKDAETVKGLQA